MEESNSELYCRRRLTLSFPFFRLIPAWDCVALHHKVWFPQGRDHNGGQGSSHPHHLSRAIVTFGQTLACCDVPYNACLLVSLPACPDPSQTLKTHLITPSSVLCDTELPTPPHSHFYISLYALFPPLKIPTQAAPSLWSPEPTSRQFPPHKMDV